MAKIISVVNQKGGVGKTTTVVNLACALSEKGVKTLVLDMDPQGNTSTGLGVPSRQRSKNVYNLLVSDTLASESLINISCSNGNFDLISSVIDLSGADIELSELKQKERILKNKLSEIQNNYDYILIDCPPSLGMLTINALVASHSVIIPLQCEFFALEGLAQLIHTLEVVKSKANKDIKIEGILLTMYDSRNKLTLQVEEEVKNTLSKKLFKTKIPRNVRVAEAPSHGKPIMDYDLYCPGSLAYIRLAKEILQNN